MTLGAGGGVWGAVGLAAAGGVTGVGVGAVGAAVAGGVACFWAGGGATGRGGAAGVGGAGGLLISLRTSPGFEICDRSIFVLISSDSAREARLDLAALCDSAAA